MTSAHMPETASTETAAGRAWAQREAAQRLLNAYLREIGVFDPRVSEEDLRKEGLLGGFLDEWCEEGEPMRLKLPNRDEVLYGTLRYVSATGHHRYGSRLWIRRGTSKEVRPVSDSRELAASLLGELALASADASPSAGLAEELLKQVDNSIEKTVTYASHSLKTGRSLWRLDARERFHAAEQSLVGGHPFHPAPKSSHGFTSDDLARYAPELGASFRLHYFACDREIVRESMLDATRTDGDWFPQAVREAAELRLGPDRPRFRLIPCHPWQANHLQQWPVVQELLHAGLLVDLGPLGEPVYPTSSVRTVSLPAHPYFYKLPLNVRITNFIRVNPLEQLERTIDASRALQAVTESLPVPAFTILHEVGYRTIAPPGMSGEARQRLAESFGCIVREQPSTGGRDVPLVLAALLEQPPRAGEPPLAEAVRMAAEAERLPVSRTFVERWLRQYLEISLVPLLWLFCEHGVSIEAHVQNTLVALQDGWPVHVYVRDLEGVSISRRHASERGWIGPLIAADSPVLYTEEEAWHRFQYYVTVNHLGHLIHTLAYNLSLEETALWRVVADMIRTAPLLQQPAYAPYLQDLLQSKRLPAKANLISCFYRRGERPLYVTIPNPLAAEGGRA